MADSGRIRIAKDKAELVKELASDDTDKGVFQTFAEVVVFAAALGVKHQRQVPLREISKREPAPIRLDIFASNGYDWLIKVLGVNYTGNIQILAPDEDQNQAYQIFEEYANGGLEILQGELHGAVDYSERILLLLNYERDNSTEENEEFDLSRFLT
ncbi:DNA phosphorothioation-associated protein 4 [Calothrix sp. 336/3]|uniref:DNA phosphorothioation-associated protein 4 n=1 Tax=Calothrix sp. 336/3 TaxID=1337936 RepID=UPI0004E3D01F|nr:DNA phosphorothioation-associated protein 4 [Calothrix sp. 336/3]AKG22162.1 dnd system-associated protein 4 [Calothrix sp. 336/3]